MIFCQYAAVDAYDGGGCDDYDDDMLWESCYGHCTSASHLFYVVYVVLCLGLIFCTIIMLAAAHIPYQEM